MSYNNNKEHFYLTTTLTQISVLFTTICPCYMLYLYFDIQGADQEWKGYDEESKEESSVLKLCAGGEKGDVKLNRQIGRQVDR